MRTVYELAAKAVCPIDGAVIDYGIVLTVDRSGLAVIPVEILIEFVASETAAPTMQEDLTARLSDRLGPDVGVQTVGVHSGVRITCTA
jgi:hypothetical protein